ncbi:type VI secretion system contractile sheath small subunit [Archangium violaceum]|uniref:type VI secretion system contractile sheath small subunit n=1 Tax=Archangium violaceum TaxID=83451 RepID=UPI00194E8743|nr:type VI secretion system contractile sheath small subunit [Archangium violaceum]QRN93345.1 type VI secretion system contractile sheath small subunit [Archangium violaceum]
MPIQDKLPKSRITLVYRTKINGQQEDVKLPFRVVVLGDFSLGSSTDRQVDLEERKMRSVTGSNINDLMKDMAMSLSFDVVDKVSADGEGRMQIDLPINRMKSFHPDEIVHHVPKLKALMLLRKLLLEMQADIDNRKELRRTLYELFSNKEQLQKLLESDQLKSYVSMRLPKAAPQSTQPALAAANAAAAKA